MRFGIGGFGKDKPDDEEGEKRKTILPTRSPLGPEKYDQIELALGYSFKDRTLLERAFTHRSVPQKGKRRDYERLEFLGDAVLDLAVADLLLHAHPESKEGELSKMRAALVNTNSLSQIARAIGLGQFVILSSSELANGGADRSSILADVFEAVIGAIYREAGFDTALGITKKFFGEIVQTVTPRDPKTELQEVLQANGSEVPLYLLECVEGPEHAPTFVSVVEVDGQIVGRGRGTTKKASQQAAAAEAMERVSGKDEIDDLFMETAEKDAE